MRVCSSCGAKIPDGSKFCTECGAPAPSGSAILQEQQEKGVGREIPVQPAGSPGKRPEGGKRGKRPAVIGAVVVLVLGTLLLKGCSSGSKDPENGGFPTEDAASGSLSVETEAAGKMSDAQTGSFAASSGTADQNGASEIEQKWNGTWYGLLHVIDSEGLEYIASGDNIDAYMVVDVGADGKGTFEVYLYDEFDSPYISAECEAGEGSLQAVSGEAFATDMHTYNWMFLPMPDFPDQYSMGDTITDEGYTLDFTMFVKKWGADWKSEANAGNLLPPGIDGYNAAIDAGELPPIGKAPYGYEEDAAEPAKESTEETIEETTKEAEKETVQESTAAAVGFDSGNGTGTISDFSGNYSANISFTLPETGWKIKNQGSTNSTLYLYNVTDPTYLFSGDPRIEFNLKESMETIDRYKDKFENLQEIAPRTVGGIELSGRTYKYVGMEWTEYYGELPGGGWLSLLISEVSIEPGSEGDAVLNSVTIE